MNRRRKIGIALGIIVIITTGCIWHMVSSQQKEVKVFTATLAFPGSEMEADNYMEDKIAELTGARAEVTWLDGQNPSDLVKSMIDLQIAQQKANVSLQYTVAVRNAFVQGYKELMNLQF